MCQVMGSVLLDCFHPPHPPPPNPLHTHAHAHKHFRPQMQAQVYHLCFSPTGYTSEVPTIPSFGLINLLTWLTELRETFHLLDQ